MSTDKSDELVKVAELYFVEEKTQQQIADLLSISRPKVSRLLSVAKSSGVVRIEIHHPSKRLGELSILVQDKFNLDRCAVTHTYPSPEVTQAIAGRQAAQELEQVLTAGDIIGVTWGKSVRAVVDHVSPPSVRGAMVVQMAGSLGEGNPDLDGHEIARLLAKQLNCGHRIVSAPTVANSREACDYLKEQPAVAATLKEASHANIALFGVGSLDDPENSLHRIGFLDEAERQSLLGSGAVGHAVGQVFDVNGEGIPSFNKRVVAIGFHDLARVPTRLAVATGTGKTIALGAALRGGLISHLVVDEDLATSLIENA
jgi:deoxyribonucleoside regulator